MFVPTIKESTKKQVHVRTSAEISEMVTFNKMGQAIEWVHAIDYEALLEKQTAANKILDEYQATFPYAATTTIDLVTRLRLVLGGANKQETKKW